MSRRERREARRMVGVLQAVEVCDRCGAPICPVCELETFLCGQCSDYHCEGCGCYIDPPPLVLH